MMNTYEYYKDRLGPKACMIYEGLINNISQLDFEGFVERDIQYYDSVMQDAKDAYKALRLDRPEYYFLGHSIRIKCISTGVLTVQHNMKYSQNHILRMNRILKRTVNDLIVGTDKLSSLEKEEKIYRNVGKAFSYKDGQYSHDLSGLLVFKDGVCESLSGMLVVAFREVGIRAVVVQGYARNQRHRWCKVWVDNKECYVDVTWDMNNCKYGTKLKYFNLSYDQMSHDHKFVDAFANEHI